MKTLAIIGTGIAGLGCAYFLQRRFDITVFERNDYAGGHTNTVVVEEDGRAVPIDTGFMVFNRVTYPNLTRLLAELGVETKPTRMSFSVQHVPSGLEYNGGSLDLLFVQRWNLFNPRHWRMLGQINRFNQEAEAALEDPRFAALSLGEYVAARGYGEAMLNLYLLPMAGAVWSTPPDKMREFPAATLLRFWHNHGLLGLDSQHPWYTVAGGAKCYVEKMTAAFRERVQLRKMAVQVRRENGGARVISANGEAQWFDKVILACHADQALGLIQQPTEQETRLLRVFEYQPNTATLHTDESFMPRIPRGWASWNYRLEADDRGQLRPTVHYWMNSLQGVSREVNYFVSLNCHEQVAPEKVLRRIEYEHPVFNRAAIDAQRELPGLNRLAPDQAIYYAGAWFKYGFHEDGLTSALECARAITDEPLWS
jgi:uncharacterized protein